MTLHPYHSPYRAGWADAVLNREPSSPWKDAGFMAIRKNLAYVKGYMAGKQNAKQHEEKN